MAGWWMLGGAFLSFLGSRSASNAQDAQREEYDEFLDKQLELNQKQHDLNWQNIQDDYLFAQNSVDIAKQNNQLEIAWRESNDLQDWIWEDQTRIKDFNNQASAFNASVDQAATQMEYNALAAEIAGASEDRLAQDKLTALGFQNEKLIQNYRQSEELSQQDLSEADRRLSAISRGQDITGESLEFQLEAANKNAQMNAALLAANYGDKKAQEALKLQDTKIKGIQTLGKIQASGQTGRSARKQLQSQLASQGFLQTALYESMTRTDSRYHLDISNVAQTLEAQANKINISSKELANTVLTESEKAEQAKLTTSTKISHKLQQVDIAQNEMKKSVDSLADAYASQMDNIALQQYGQDMNALNNIIAAPVLAPEQPMPLDYPETIFQDPRNIYSLSSEDKIGDYTNATWHPETTTDDGVVIPAYMSIHGHSFEEGDPLPDVDPDGNVIGYDADADDYGKTNWQNRAIRDIPKPIKGHNTIQPGNSALTDALMIGGNAAINYGMAK